MFLTRDATLTLVPKSEKDKEIKELTDKISELEASLKEVTKPYTEIAAQLRQFQGVVQKYFRIIDLYQKHGVLAVDVILPEVKDRISKEIIRILFDHPGYNITQIAEELRARTGTSSRRIVREKLSYLVRLGFVSESVGKKAKVYKVSDQVVKKWSEVLGLSK